MSDAMIFIVSPSLSLGVELRAVQVSPLSIWKSCQLRLLFAFAASSVCASANVRTIADANPANDLGVSHSGS